MAGPGRKVLFLSVSSRSRSYLCDPRSPWFNGDSTVKVFLWIHLRRSMLGLKFIFKIQHAW
ncbi:Protein of unknown function [Pyronema omphalodes CBS 100304]|uniref:Uncharacterized protein n=1 Tax=Pyronema omphalodes (strain CBS 100304) TaxID=1076935 RepID=U4KWS4_PYROM|nr:Protein of unknown function [Pyronema omphalodes CBS 100304]